MLIQSIRLNAYIFAPADKRHVGEMCSTYKKFYAGRLKYNNNLFPQTIEQLYTHRVYRPGRPGQARRFL